MHVHTKPLPPELVAHRPPPPAAAPPKDAGLEKIFERWDQNKDRKQRSGSSSSDESDLFSDGKDDSFSAATASLTSTLAALDLDQHCGAETPAAGPADGSQPAAASLDDLLRRAAA